MTDTPTTRDAVPLPNATLAVIGLTAMEWAVLVAFYGPLLAAMACHLAKQIGWHQHEHLWLVFLAVGWRIGFALFHLVSTVGRLACATLSPDRPSTMFLTGSIVSEAVATCFALLALGFGPTDEGTRMPLALADLAQLACAVVGMGLFLAFLARLDRSRNRPGWLANRITDLILGMIGFPLLIAVLVGLNWLFSPTNQNWLYVSLAFAGFLAIFLSLVGLTQQIAAVMRSARVTATSFRTAADAPSSP